VKGINDCGNQPAVWCVGHQQILGAFEVLRSWLWLEFDRTPPFIICCTISPAEDKRRTRNPTNCMSW